LPSQISGENDKPINSTGTTVGSFRNKIKLDPFLMPGSIPSESNIRCKMLVLTGTFLYKFRVRENFLTMTQHPEGIKEKI
jgi:hypothetical protein